MKTKSDFYGALLPLLNAGRLALLDSPRLLNQLVGLERRTARGGRASIDHAPGSHDDVANAAAIALVTAAGDPGPTLIHRDALTRDGAAADPYLVVSVYATVWVTLFGTAAVVYAGVRFDTGDLVILDIAELTIRGPVLDGVARRLDDLAERAMERWRGRPVGAWLFVPDAWTDQAAAAVDRAFLPRLARGDAQHRAIGSEAIPTGLLVDPVRLMYGASVHTGSGRVSFAAEALAKAEGMPLFGALQWGPGRERIEDSALRMAALLSVALAFNPEASTAIPAWPGREAA